MFNLSAHNNTKITKLLVFMFICININTIQAQNITDVMWNFSFTLPNGWQYQKGADGAILGHNSIAGIIYIFPHQIETKQALQAEMKKGLNEEGLFLQLQGKLQKITKNSFAGNYTGFYQMQEVKARAYGDLLKNGGGAIVIAMSTPQTYTKQLSAAGESIIKSVKYKKVPKSDMQQYFVGKWSTYTKYSETHIYFYPNGTYQTSNSSSYGNSDASVGATWGMAHDNNNGGYWSVQGNMKRGRITLQGNNGSTQYIDYVIQGKEMYFNGTLYGYSAQ